ncbi:MAG: ABC transporter substrate-binding protein [Bacteroidales bacterium]|nr:ABC transporter substrate-binding protein [Bacteroidales bacterium]
MKRYIFTAVMILLVFSLACNRKKEHQQTSILTERDYPEFASRFSFGQYKDYPVIFLHDPWSPEKINHKVLCLPRDKEVPSAVDDYEIIRTPVREMVTMSGTQIASIKKLRELSSIKGIGNKNQVNNATLKAKMEKGEVKEVGRNGDFYNEILIELAPDIILVSPFKGQSYEKLEALGMTILPYADYLEQHPLGRAEWIKVMGILYDKQEIAWEYFHKVENHYRELKALTDSIKDRPMVFSAKPYGGTWHMPGGESYMAHFFADAGARYLWEDNTATASLSLDFETVYSKAAEADFWKLLVKSPQKYSYDQLKAEDERYSDFKAFQQKNVLVCNVTKTPYYEKGALEPDIILADFIHAFHGDLLEDYHPQYFKTLSD